LDEAHIDDGILTLDSDAQVVLCDLDVKVASLEVSRNLSSQVYILDGLHPLVGELGLLFGLAGNSRLVGGFAL
jgi:hypothetical protein